MQPHFRDPYSLPVYTAFLISIVEWYRLYIGREKLIYQVTVHTYLHRRAL